MNFGGHQQNEWYRCYVVTRNIKMVPKKYQNHQHHPKLFKLAKPKVRKAVVNQDILLYFLVFFVFRSSNKKFEIFRKFQKIRFLQKPRNFWIKIQHNLLFKFWSIKLKKSFGKVLGFTIFL